MPFAQRCSFIPELPLLGFPLQSILQHELWRSFEEIRERLWFGNSNPGDIVPTRGSFQMSIRAECDEFN
jgi:hypothetical protein